MKRALLLLVLCSCDVMLADRHVRADAGASAVAVADAAPRERDPFDVENEAKAMLVAWRDAQNAGSVDAFMGLFAPDFVGERPSAERIASRAVEVAVDKAKYRFAGDGGDLAAGEAEIRFVERWRADAHTEHDDMRIVMAPAAVDKHFRIIRAELVGRRVGWDDEPSVEVDGVELRSPVALRLGWEPKAEAITSLVLTATDAKNKVAHVVIVTEKSAVHAKDPPSKPASGGFFYELGWSGVGGARDDFRVVREGDNVVVKHRVGESEEASVWVDERVLILASGTKVTAR